MADTGVDTLPPDIDPAARSSIGTYLDELARGLPGSRRARNAILAEVGDGLADTVETHRARGATPDEAARAAVAEFGSPRALAAHFATELAGATAHRVGLALICTGPVVGLVWLAAFIARGDGLDWRSDLGALLSSIPTYAVVLALVMPAAFLATAGGGVSARRLPIGPRLAAAAASVAAIGCVAGDATLITGVLVSTVRTADASWLAVAAVLVSGVRLTLAGFAARRCATLRAAAA
ncbi:hypothetical protein GCM10009557_11280 [Virgisporangium ochraceum]|uniref:Uncharacterized protein n=1 Tax=Virgisporangium ochraceum TaxID=65505 RepID=A0A8J4ECM8_9ACTN|nr:permease prefix domain 1-containing protein [Virgisporangium ochraceum]GIJ70660.1 hypothetical protein Voc01_055770 [Virgisporangium ochraceum]